MKFELARTGLLVSVGVAYSRSALATTPPVGFCRGEMAFWNAQTAVTAITFMQEPAALAGLGLALVTVGFVTRHYRLTRKARHTPEVAASATRVNRQVVPKFRGGNGDTSFASKRHGLNASSSYGMVNGPTDTTAWGAKPPESDTSPNTIKKSEDAC